MRAMVSSGTMPPDGVRMKSSDRSSTCDRYASSSRTLMKYSLPVFGSVNGIGANCVLPTRLVSTVCATCCSDSPSVPAFWRSTTTSSCG